ncbi:MAG: hypothetical protein AAF243_16415 [Cyanobacteria bacterium P01_A01_bin.137]
MTDETTQLLERHFDTAFDAPDGIEKLRELILTLAIQGKLVNQDVADPSASKLLQVIKSHKQELIETGKIRKNKKIPEIKLENAPYVIPDGWEWVRFGSITGVWQIRLKNESATGCFFAAISSSILS